MINSTKFVVNNEKTTLCRCGGPEIIEFNEYACI